MLFSFSRIKLAYIIANKNKNSNSFINSLEETQYKEGKDGTGYIKLHKSTDREY